MKTEQIKSEVKHTPGPWRIEADRQHGEHFDTILIRTAEWDESGHERNFTVARITGCENAQANARLIAAAPDLLEALKEIAKGEGEFSRDPYEHAKNA